MNTLYDTKDTKTFKISCMQGKLPMYESKYLCSLFHHLVGIIIHCTIVNVNKKIQLRGTFKGQRDKMCF